MIRVCPPIHRWRALLADDLPPADQADLNGHLELCPDCQRTLEECAARPDVWAAARTLGVMTQPRSSVLRDVIDQLKLDPETDHGSRDGAELPIDFLDPCEHAPSLGRIHQYEILEEVGRGGMGVVLKALDPGLHRVVAIKVLAPQLAVSGTARKRFTREARAAAAVGHENVVTIHAVEEFKGLPYLVMQYVAGPSVQQRIADAGPLPVAEILRIGFQTAAGLAAAHAQGLIHRDVKPANILLENGVERVKLTDFSLARAIDDASVTQTGVVTGTPPYMAPEQARGEPLDHRADLFSLGSVVYAMCTGRPPFRGQPLEVLRKVSEETPVSIRTLNPEIPTWLESIVNKLMAKNPDGRYQSAGEVAAVLEQCLAHVQQPTISPLPASVVEKRRPHWTEIALPILAGLFVIAAVLYLRVRTDHGTLEIAVDDPAATVTVDGTEIVVAGMQGMKEFRLRAGDYTVRETKDGKPQKVEVVSIKQGEKTPLRVTFEPDAAGKGGVPGLSELPHVGPLFRTKEVERQRDIAELNAARARQALADLEAERDEEIRRLKDMESTLSLKRTHLLQTLGEKHPSIKEVDDQVAEIRRTMSKVRRAETDPRRPAAATGVTEPRRTIRTGIKGGISAAVVSPGGTTVIVAGQGGIEAYDLASGKKRFDITGRDDVSRALAVSPDGKLLASGGDGPTIRLWDLATGKQVRLLDLQAGDVASLAFSPDGTTLAVGGPAPKGRGVVTLFDMKAGDDRRIEFPAPVRSLAFDPAGEHRLAVGLASESVRIVDLLAAKELYPLRQPGPVPSLAFSPDGRRLAASGGKNEIDLWTSPNGWLAANHRGVDKLVGHGDRVTSVRFSPTGLWVATSSLDGTARLWDARGGKPVATFNAGAGELVAAEFTPDGKSLVTAGEDGVIRVWDVAAVGAATAPRRGAQRTDRTLRWTLSFDSQSGDDYLKQLQSVGAILAFRTPDGRTKVIRDLERRPAEPVSEDVQNLDRLVWVEVNPDAVAMIAKTFGLDAVPNEVMVLFPRDFEEQLLTKELAYRNKSESEIRETRFQIRIRGGGPEITVTDQAYVDGATPSGGRVLSPAPPEKRYQVRFNNIAWRAVLEWLGDQTGLPVTGAKPAGTFTFVPPAMAKDGYTMSEIIDILNDDLIAQNRLLIRTDKALTIFQADEKSTQLPIPLVKADELTGRGRSELVNMLISLRYTKAEEMTEFVKKRLGPFGELSADGRTNSLILRDTAGNLRAILQMIDQLDRPAPGR
jgi:serine/threonine-protein kinase